MKINQSHTIIRLVGLVILVMGLSALSLLIIKVIKTPDILYDWNFYVGFAVSLVFIFAGTACWVSDSIVIFEDCLCLYEIHLINRIEKIILRDEVLKFCLRDAKIVAKRKQRDGKEIILILKNGDEVLVKEADSLTRQQSLLKKINEKWGS